MRKAATAFIAALGLMALVAGPASATPTVHFKAVAVPIPGFKHTGNIRGAGAAVSAEYRISGSEYYGGPAPLKEVKFYLPSGVTLYQKGFKTCSTAVISENFHNCSGKSAAGPIGSLNGTVSLEKSCEVEVARPTRQEVEAKTGTPKEEALAERNASIASCKTAEKANAETYLKRISESASIRSFYTPGGITFFTLGYEPVLLEITSAGHYSHLHGGGGFGPLFSSPIPLVETLPGAPAASAETINVKVGGAYKKGKKTYYYGTMPKKCPKHHLVVKTELTFYPAEDPIKSGNHLPESHVTAFYNAPCPKRH